MNILDGFVFIGIGLWTGLAVFYITRKKRSKNSGVGCMGCTGCPYGRNGKVKNGCRAKRTGKSERKK